MPVSSVTTAPSVSLEALSSSPRSRTSSPRRGAGRSRHAPKALLARAMTSGISAGRRLTHPRDLCAVDRRPDGEVVRSTVPPRRSPHDEECLRWSWELAPFPGVRPFFDPNSGGRASPSASPRGPASRACVARGAAKAYHASMQIVGSGASKGGNGHGAFGQCHFVLRRSPGRVAARLCDDAPSSDGPHARCLQYRRACPSFLRRMVAASGGAGDQAAARRARGRDLQSGDCPRLRRQRRPCRVLHRRLWREPERPAAASPPRSLLHRAGFPRQRGLRPPSSNGRPRRRRSL